mmetsp:Transcript_79044/g.131970  ORF Transcript_79044/g.131970 Transcript_79044/m.131970 type:complete len:238 (+) Transcript_79044:186-899(+)
MTVLWRVKLPPPFGCVRCRTLRCIRIGFDGCRPRWAALRAPSRRTVHRGRQNAPHHVCASLSEGQLLLHSAASLSREHEKTYYSSASVGQMSASPALVFGLSLYDAFDVLVQVIRFATSAGGIPMRAMPPASACRACHPTNRDGIPCTVQYPLCAPFLHSVAASRSWRSRAHCSAHPFDRCNDHLLVSFFPHAFRGCMSKHAPTSRVKSCGFFMSGGPGVGDPGRGSGREMTQIRGP